MTFYALCFQLYEDTVEMQMFFIRKRDDLSKNGEILLTPALSYTYKHLQTIVEVWTLNVVIKGLTAL